MEFIIDEIGHLCAYSVLACLVYLLWKDKYFTKNYLFGLLLTILIDVDHFFDYFLYKGLNFNLREFFVGDYFHKNGKVIIFLHSWEIPVILLFIYLTLKEKEKYRWLIFVIITFLAHLAYDALYYGFDWTSYFFIKRLITGFGPDMY